ncbi:metal-dependent transcriptional regulator [bacterium]|nr:metal-dependent transcriptional regulator [bacterium]
MTETNRPSPTIEDYLGVIYTLDRDGERVIAARLAESLDVSAPTVTATLKRMQRDGWVALDGDKVISLTAGGKSAAMSVIRRHMLTEWMLSRMLKLPLSELHREAHQIEHTLSPEVAERLQAEMEDPRFCPHGNPLPGYEAEADQWVPLSEIAPGSNVIVRRIQENLEEDYAILSFLETKGVIPGAALFVIEALPFNETIKVQIKDRDLTLGLNLASGIFVSGV